MATKDDQDCANPFSFSNFVLKKEDKDDLNEVKENGTNNCDSVQEDNPFSFQKFKPKSDEPLKPKNKKLLIVDDVDAVGDDIFADVSPLKSVNTKKSKKKKENFKNISNTEDTNLELPNNLLVETEKNDTPLFLNTDDSIDESTDNDDDNLSSSPQTDTYILPDPLSDGTDNDLLEQLHLLKLENTDLREDLEKMKKEYKEHKDNSDEKVKRLRTELEKVRKKEAEDTQALEDVVRMVEENLQTTTTRALKAESTVTKLREELRMLKENQVSMADYEQLQREHYLLLNTIREKSMNAAQLMRVAADKTEPHIRQLQSGVQSLRFLAEQFDGIGMITELPKTNNNKPDS